MSKQTRVSHPITAFYSNSLFAEEEPGDSATVTDRDAKAGNQVARHFVWAEMEGIARRHPCIRIPSDSV